MVLKSEKFFADNWQAVRAVLDHAGLPPQAGLEGLVRQGAKNAAHANSGKRWAGSGYQKLQPRERRRLCSFYAPHNAELYALVQQDFQWEVECGRDQERVPGAI